MAYTLTEKERRELEGAFQTAVTQRNAGYSPNSTTLSSSSASMEELIRQEEEARKAAYNDRISNAQKLNNLDAKYSSVVDSLNSKIKNYGQKYGQQRDNRGILYQAQRDFDSIRVDINDLLDELDTLGLDDESRKAYRESLEELLKATDSMSLDATSRIAAYNNPATQRIMQQEDADTFAWSKYDDYERMLQSMPNRLATQALTYAPYDYQGLAPSVANAKMEAMPEGNAKEAVRTWLDSPTGKLITDSALGAEIERLKGISVDTAINSVKQTISDLDEKANEMKRYWDEQAYLNDDSGSAPDYAEYEKLLEERAKYESILDDLYNDEDSDEMSGYTWVDDSIVRSHLSENYNAANLYDRVNKAYFDTTVDFGVEYTPNRGVKTSSYPIAQRPENYMTQEERDTFNKLWHYESEDAAREYFERLTPTLEARGAQQVTAEAKQFTEDYPNWAWVQARGANAMKPISSASMIGDILSGEGVRENSAANMNTQVANFVDSYAPEVTNYTGDTKFFGRDLDQFLYGTVGSTVDSAVRMMTASFIGGAGAGASAVENAKGIARASNALMSLEVFPTAVLQEKEKGRSDSEAVVLGTLRAAIEGFTERYSVELLLSPSKNFGELLLKGAFAEGSEEIAATVLNGAVDIIAADKDNIIKEWERRTALGIDSVEALADIIYERGMSTLADGLSGALSGLLFTAGGGSAGAFNITASDEAKNIAKSSEDVAILISEVLKENPDNKVALRAKAQLEAGKAVSEKTVQKLFNEQQQAFAKTDVQEIAYAAATELEIRGERVNVNQTAEAIAKSVTGEQLSDTEESALRNSVFGKQIISELNGEVESRGNWTAQLRDNLEVLNIAPKKAEPKAVQRVNTTNATAETNDGGNVRILGLTDRTDGTVGVRVEDASGNVREVAASDLKLDEDMKYLIDAASEFKGAAAVVYEAYVPGTDVGQYLSAASLVASYAKVAAGDVNTAKNVLRAIKKSGSVDVLSDIQTETIFNATLNEAVRELAKAKPAKTSGKGNFTYNVKSVAESDLKGRKASAVRFLRHLAEMYPGIDIEVFESKLVNGKYVGEQGSYKDGKIRIDINAGINTIEEQANSAMLRTLSHELTHHLQKTAPKQYAALKAFIFDHLAEWNNGKELEDLITSKQQRAKGHLSREAAIDEVVADSCEMMLANSKAIKQLAQQNKTLAEKIKNFVKKFIIDLKASFEGVEANDAAARYLKKFENEMQRLWDNALRASVENAMTSTAIPAANTLMNPMQETEFSLREDEKFMQNAIKANEAKQLVPYRVMTAAQNARSAIAEIMRDPKLQDALNLPADLMGKTYFPDGAYNGTEENTLVCPRSMGAEELLDAVSEMIGRPLTVDECIEVSQFIAGSEFKPECEYCYVATDRKAYRAFLNSYIEQRDSVIEKYKGGMNKAALYEEFRDGRKDTKDMRDRFNLWIKVVDHNLPMMQASDLTNVNNLMHDIIEPGIKDQVKDAMKYAQKASWAKKRVGYTAYNGHILKWSQTKINQLNKGFGLRMYSFSDFSPAFILENMQMITDASVRGLKMLAYTKEADFVKIFAPSGININVSTFGFERNGVVAENAMQGVSWAEAQELRAKYPNVGITFVATNDNLVNWALEQDWIDVVIPYHLVRTGKQVAKALGFTNYTSESSDIKAKDWTKGKDANHIAPTMHNNDKQTYLNALEENHLKPRFERWIDHPNYMKLVNETRLSAQESKAVQPIFDTEYAKKSLLGMIKDGGYFQHIGGSVDRMYEIASELAEKFNSDTEQFSERDHIATRDSLGNELSEQQQKFFAKSKAVDRNGKLVLLYHGTTNGGFTVFDSQFSDDKLSLFAADNLNMAFTYSGSKDVLNLPKGKPAALRWTEGSGTKGKGQVGVYQVYYNLTNPLIIDGHGENWDNLSVGEHDVVSFRVSQASGGSMYGDVPVVVEITTNGRTRTTSFSSVSEMRSELTSKYNSSVASAVSSKTMRSVQSGNEVTHKIHWSNETHKEVPTMTTRDLAKKAKAEGYDGLIVRNIIDSGKYGKRTDSERGTIYVAFDSNQIKSVDNKNPTSHKDIRYSERDYAASEISRLEQRIEALEQGKSDAFLAGEMRVARQAGKETRQLEQKIEKLEGKLAEAKRIAKDTKKATAEERKAAALRAKNLEAQIKKVRKEAMAEGFLAGQMSVAQQAGKEVRNREELIAELKQELADKKAAYKETLSNFRESRDVHAYRERVVKRIRNLQDMLITNSDKKHIPEMLKEPLGNFLMGLDTSSATKLKGKGETKADADMYRRTELLKQALERARNNTDSGSYLDLPDEFMERIEELSGMIHEITGGVDAVADAPINRMNSSQLNDLNFVLRTLQHSINSMNKMLATARFQTVAQAAESTISELDQIAEYQEKGRPRGEGKDAYAEIVRNMLNWKNTTPVYAFDRMGEAGKELFKAMWEGQGVFARLTKEFLEFREKLVSNEQVRKWSQDVQTIKLSDNRSVRMTTANMMTFYCLANRQQALKHLQTGGMKISTISYGKQSVQQARPFYLSAEDITKIANMVKGDAKRVADQMQKYMTERGSVLGNEISMARFGYNAFTEPVYFPIRTESSQIAKDTKSTQENSINRLLNMSFTKSTQPNAETSVVIDNIFDVFSAHMSDMAKYNAFALPVLDMIKWYDYSVQDRRADGTQKDHRSVQTSIQAAYGKEALRYISTFLEDVNGADEGGRTRSAGWAQKLTSHYKAAAVGANLRVAIQQPTSYWRAAAVLNPKYLAIGEKVMWHNTAKVKKEMEQYAGISIWKSLGFRDFNVGRSVREQIAGTLSAAELTYDATMEASMWLASAGDTWTWCRLWEACKAEVKATQKLSGEALMQATADRFNDVIARTQVVDSVMTRSHTMRSKNLYDQLTTPFMAEPTLSYNIVSSALFEYSTEVRRSNKQTAWKKYGKNVGRAALVFILSSSWTAVFQSLSDATRDDDDYEEFWKKFLDAMLPGGKVEKSFKEDPLGWIEEVLDQGNLLSNLNLANNIPGVHRSLLNALKGFAGDAMWQEGIKNLLNAAGAASELIALEAGWTDKATDKTWNGNMTWWGAMQKGLQAFSQLTSLPIYNMVRDVTALYNTTVQEFFGRQDLKLLSYDPGTEGRIANAYADGFLTFEEAMDEMEKFGIAADTAYEKLVKAAGASSKYDALKEAITSGGDVKAVMEELAGYGIKEDLIEKQVKSTIKDLVLGTEEAAPTMDKQTAKNLLVEYLGMSYPEAHYAVEAFGVDGFSKYDDVRDAILNGGDVDAAIAELVEYGTSEKTVRQEISTSIRIWYQGETKDDGTVVDPIINREQAVEMLVQHGGKKPEDAEKLVTEWTLALDTGMKSDDVKESFLNDEISTDEAIDLRMTYFGQTEEEAAQTVSEWMFEDEFGFSYDDRNIRFRDGEISAAEMVEIEMDYGGRTKEEAQKNLVGKVMDGYKDGSFSESEAMSMLTTNGGLTSDEATKKIRYADAVAAYPDADIDDAWVDEYYAEVESSGISFNTFIDYRTSVKSIKGEGKKENRMAVIDSLPLSPAQKDALYYAEGWAESTIGEAPWH